ncbi:acetyltransferase [Xylariaceae sp. FL0594]|nr:acetyltransferase [Xylariaceae sp. FL0594]
MVSQEASRQPTPSSALTQASTPTATRRKSPSTAIIATNRFLIRPFEESDAAGLASTANDVDISRWMRSRFPSPYTLQDAEWWIAHCRSGQPPAMLNFGIFTLDSEEDDEEEGGFEQHAGSVGLEQPKDDVVYAGTRELGYYMAKRCRGKGIMTEAVREFTRWAFAYLPDLLRIEAHVHEENEASQRVLTKAGFVREGTRRMAFAKHGKVSGEHIFGLIRSDLD